MELVRKRHSWAEKKGKNLVLSAAINGDPLRSCENQSFVICDRNISHNMPPVLRAMFPRNQSPWRGNARRRQRNEPFMEVAALYGVFATKTVNGEEW